MRELDAHHEPTGAEQLGGLGHCGGGILDVVQYPGEQDPVVRATVLERTRGLGELVRQVPPLIAKGVRLGGPGGQGHRILVDVDAGDVVASAGQLQGDVAQPGTDVEDPALAVTRRTHGPPERVRRM